MKTKILGLAMLLANSMVLSLGHAKQHDESTIQMQLSWRHQFQFAGYYAALEKGFYKEAGLTVQLLEGGPTVHCGGEVLRDVDYCNAPGSIVKERIEGQPIVALASIIQHSPIVLITKRNSNLYTPRDLIGKKVEVLWAGEPVPEIQAMFQNEGVKLKQLKMLENTMGISSLLAGNTDAIYGFSSNEPYQMRKQGVDYNLIKPKRYGIDFYGDVLVTSEREIENHPERAKKFLEASLRGWRYAMDHQQEMADLIMEKYPSGKPRESLLAEAKVIEELMLPNLIEIGRMNSERWRHTADTLVSLGLVKPDYSLLGFIYNKNDKPSYLTIIVSLLVGLVLMTIGMVILWLYNKRLSIEIAERTEAQERLRKAKETVDKIAYMDDLSGLGSRRAFYEQADDVIKLTAFNKSLLSLIVIDIDHFKKINDQFGHLVGDEAIRAVAHSILSSVRSRDIHGRIGGEEFAILLPETDLQGAIDLAQRIRRLIESISILPSGYCLSITASFGVTVYQKDDDMTRLMQRADRALYSAKDQGRNQVISL